MERAEGKPSQVLLHRVLEGWEEQIDVPGAADTLPLSPDHGPW